MSAAVEQPPVVGHYALVWSGDHPKILVVEEVKGDVTVLVEEGGRLLELPTDQVQDTGQQYNVDLKLSEDSDLQLAWSAEARVAALAARRAHKKLQADRYGDHNPSLHNYDEPHPDDILKGMEAKDALPGLMEYQADPDPEKWQSGKWVPTNPDTPRRFIDAATTWGGEGYRDIQRSLRSGVPGKWSATVNALDEMMKESIPARVTTYRGIQKLSDLIPGASTADAESLVGTEFSSKGFVPTTLHLGAAMEFTHGQAHEGSSDKAMMEMVVEPGDPCFYLGEWPKNESELLLPREGRWKVTDVKMQKDVTRGAKGVFPVFRVERVR